MTYVLLYSPFFGSYYIPLYLGTVYPFLGLVYQIYQYTKYTKLGLKSFSESLDGSKLSELPETDLLLLFREVFTTFT